MVPQPAPDSIDSFAMLADVFVKAHARAIKVETRKSDLFKVKQRDNEMLREFVSRFQMKQMDLPPVADDWVVQAFTQGLNPRSSLASHQQKQNLVEYPVVSWANIHNKPKRVVDHESRPVRDRYQPYGIDRRGNRSGCNSTRNERRSDRGPNSRGLMSKNGFDRPLGGREALRLSEYDFNVDASSIVSAIGHIKETKYHGTHGHRTEDCRQLREEVARLFNNGHMQEFLSDRAKNQFRNRDANKQTEQDEPQHALKFPTPGGINTVYGEQPAANEMFAIDEVQPVPAVPTLSNTEPIRKAKVK
nr:uncharacterized protein LOC104086553 [Nicotiana tomentosiformis]